MFRHQLDERQVVFQGVRQQHVFFADGVQVRGDDGSFSQWDASHYLKVKAIRSAASAVRMPRIPVDHPLTGKSLVEKESGKVYKVERVMEDWWRGKFLTALLSIGESHRTCVIENISCIDPSTIKQAESFFDLFSVQD